jgi:hypothetical protein
MIKKEELLALDDQRKALEEEIAGLTKMVADLAEAHGYNKPLVDSEGFPRADLDFHALA